MLISYLKSSGLRIRDPRWVKNQDPDAGSRSGMHILDHVSESLEPIFWVKIFKFFDADEDADPGFGNLCDPGSGIRDGKNSDPRSGINIADSQHC